MVIGSCLSSAIPPFVAALGERHCPIDFFNVNHGCHLPEAPPELLTGYDFLLIQIPIRILFPERDWMRLGPDDEVGAQALFAHGCRVLEMSLRNALAWTRQGRLPTFVANFLVPQQNPHGRFAARYSLVNPVYFVEQLNRFLYDLVASHEDTYLLDADRVSAVFGRKLVQDDAVTLFSHGGAYGDFDVNQDRHRLEVVPSMREQYGARPDLLYCALWEEAVAMFRTIRQLDAVKAVIVDLDDTLWRGVVADADEITSVTVEGWPIGFAEALLYLKKRGVLLAIVSKNDRGRIEELWPRLYADRVQLADFASVHIGWEAKAEGVARVLADLNILPGSAVFVDDNPVERHAVQAAFPDIRVLGANPYHLRRIMLWSPELQVARVTGESRARTEMVQAQVVRETARTQMSHADFLASVAPVVSVFEVFADGGPRFARLLELLNKTNQFNTTGRRWLGAELEAWLRAGGHAYAFEVTDKFTRYGLVGIALVEGDEFVQFVMSCRVLGLGVEVGALAAMVGAGLAGSVRARLVATAANLPVRDLWTRAGFEAEGDGFVLRDRTRLRCPEHVKVVDELGVLQRS